MKKRLCHRCFPMKIAKFLTTPIFKTSANSFFGKSREKGKGHGWGIYLRKRIEQGFSHNSL